MNATDYWPLAREFLIYNTAVAALQFQMDDHEACVLSSAIEQLYNVYFYNTSTYLLCQQSEEVLFSHFVTTLNVAFERKLTLEDEGYESGSENLNIPTPLRCISRIHHVSSDENISFRPSTLQTTATSQALHKPVCCQLSFSSSDDEESSAVDIPSPYSTTLSQNPMGSVQQPLSKSLYTICDDLKEDKEEDDFQTVALNDNHWTTDEIPDRHLCIHKHSPPHSMCLYPCPYMDYTPASYQDSLDLSDFSDLEDMMTTSSDEDVPALEDVFELWNGLWLVYKHLHSSCIQFTFILDTFCIGFYEHSTWHYCDIFSIGCYLLDIFIFLCIYDISFVVNATAFE